MSANEFKVGNEQGGKKETIFSKLEGMLKLEERFDGGLPIKYFPHILFIVGICIFYIGNSHYADKTIRKINKLQQEVEDARADYTTLKAKHMFASKQSEIAKSVKSLGLKESLNPPEKIVIKEGEY
ncbi:MAG: FtsL-like putative cell division protein [Bacteroidota bacterium]